MKQDAAHSNEVLVESISESRSFNLCILAYKTFIVRKAELPMKRHLQLTAALLLVNAISIHIAKSKRRHSIMSSCDGLVLRLTMWYNLNSSTSDAFRVRRRTRILRKVLRHAFSQLLIGVIILFLALASAKAEISSPEDVLGFPAGADYKLAHWESITDYLKKLAEGSDRVILENRGKTTEGHDFALVLISSPENLANREHFKAIQGKLADPRGRNASELEQLCREGKAVVLINCNLHSTEIASSQMSMELAFRLATENTQQIQEILENVIILLIPSSNPDGLNMVIDWYNRCVGTPYEVRPCLGFITNTPATITTVIGSC